MGVGSDLLLYRTIDRRKPSTGALTLEIELATESTELTENL
jgi:hypothetical protein